MSFEILCGDCLDVLDKIEDNSVDLAYLDPPFFTQSLRRLSARDSTRVFSFSDVWVDGEEYADYIHKRVSKIRDKLKSTGSIFFHCDKSASHICRMVLDSVFGSEYFQSEIIWHYRRWSNNKTGLMNNHQNIYFYSKSANFKFFRKYGDYSPTTNVDQIMQKRRRDGRNKAVYACDDNGNVMTSGAKHGVPMGDVWDIPYLNPKARERVGYPTQKPVLLLRRVIELTTEPEDLVLDPFCGSGTTLVAAESLGRRSVGIDVSTEAVELAIARLQNPVITESEVLSKGSQVYCTHDHEAAKHLSCIDYTPVQRNRGIDGVLKWEIGGQPVLLRVQRQNETRAQTVEALRNASRKKGKCFLVVVATKEDVMERCEAPIDVSIIDSTSLSLEKLEAVAIT